MLFARCCQDHSPEFGSFEALQDITDQTACVIAETVQAEAGIIVRP
jgi:acetylornithine/succinyldiaminopimelate/putrescine aminotransferase